ncbi:ribonucleoside-diphosphate reductase, adenosylcobalamin-dependent [Priestia megaterium]|nr:ribonucleoside-diphosphate reductase, adenosylcobalamin-dependent [Priestia megaterium]
MYKQEIKDKLNKDIQNHFPKVYPITEKMTLAHSGVQRLVFLDRYAFKDTEKVSLGVGDVVVLTVKENTKFPARGIGNVTAVDFNEKVAWVQVEEEYRGSLSPEEAETGIVKRNLNKIDKPVELYYEQLAKRVAAGLSFPENTAELRNKSFERFYNALVNLHLIPAGRVLYGAGSGTDVTYFNCYVMPYVKDSRDGISEHRKQVMEIMSRGGGVGTNGSTLRPRNALARGVNGKSSGSVSWLDDIAKLTHLVEQGGSRRGAQMIMLVDSHPDIIEFIISKMQNPNILRRLEKELKDEEILMHIKNKLDFTPLTDSEVAMYQGIIDYNQSIEKMKAQVESTNLSNEEKELLKKLPAVQEVLNQELYSEAVIKDAKAKLRDGGTYEVTNPEFLTGANISVCVTKELMEAVENDGEFELRFPDIENYTKEQMKEYNEKWHEVGDVRKWEEMGLPVKTYRTIRAKELWDLINICATFSAEPGIFFIDNANEMTNAAAYGQHVVATNPCGEQPLAPYSVCNLSAVNLAEMVDKVKRKVNYELLEETVRIGVRMQDNVIDATPYFLEENKKQALGERRVGLGVMGLHDLHIYCGVEYGSPEGLELVDKVFETIAVAAYSESIQLAKEKKSFPFLIGTTKENTAALREAFSNTGFMKKMPEEIRQGVIEHGIRNSHLLTVAPTGSTGTMVGVSTGLEPYFGYVYYRSGRLGKFIEVKAPIVQEMADLHGIDPTNLPNYFNTAMDLSPEAHVDVQCAIQRWIDSSISKTVNAPKGYTVQQVQKVYERLYKGGAKGGTVYVDGSRDAQVLSTTAEDNTFNEAEEIVVTEVKEEVAVGTTKGSNKEKIFLSETVPEASSTSVKIGSENGETCTICQQGKIVKSGGCDTCTNCGAQLKCGL